MVRPRSSAQWRAGLEAQEIRTSVSKIYEKTLVNRNAEVNNAECLRFPWC